MVRRLLSSFSGGPEEKENAQLSKVDYLQRVDVFKDLTREEIERVTRGFVMRECRPGTVFFMPTDPAERLFILKKGQVELYRLSAKGQRLITRRLGPMTFFGEMALLGQTMQGEFAEATEDALVCSASREDVLKILVEHPEITVKLLETLGNRLRTQDERLEQSVFSSVRVRLAKFLLTNVYPATNALAGYTHADIGDTIGALRQTVTSTLSEFERAGMIEVAPKRIKVLDKAGLEEIAFDDE